MLWAELVTSLLNHHNHQCSVILVTLVNCTLNGWIPRSIVLSNRIDNLQTSSVVRCSIIDHGDGQDKYEACVFVLMTMFKLVVSLHKSPLREKRPSPPSSPHPHQPLQVQPGDGNSGGAALFDVQVPRQQQGSLPVRHCYLQRCDDDGGVDPKELGLGSPKPERS